MGDDQKHEVFKIINRMLKTNQYINNDQCRRNGGGVLSFSKEDEKIARKNYYEKLLKTEFGCDTISGVHTLKNKCMVGKSISNLKNEKTAGSSILESKLVRSVGESGIDMIINLVN